MGPLRAIRVPCGDPIHDANAKSQAGSPPLLRLRYIGDNMRANLLSALSFGNCASCYQKEKRGDLLCVLCVWETDFNDCCSWWSLQERGAM